MLVDDAIAPIGRKQGQAGDVEMLEAAAARLGILRLERKSMSDENRLKLTLDLTEEMLAAIDAWRGLQPDGPGLEAAALKLLEKALEEAALATAQGLSEP